MLWRPTRFWALAIVAILLVAQVHVWVEPGPSQASGHICQLCMVGVWAIIAAHPGLEVALATLRLEAEPPQVPAKHSRTEASAPRAPPQA
jgi:hypothetical protein